MSILCIVLLILLAIFIFFVIIMAVDTHRLVTRDYAIELPHINKDLNVVLLSDLHSKSLGKNNQKIIDEVNRLNPDFILIAGDMYTALKSDLGLVSLDLLTNLAKKYKIYYANGNHEQKTAMLPKEFNIDYEGYLAKLSNLGITHLDNESISLDDYGIKVYGLTLPFEFYRKTSKKFPDVSLINGLIGMPEKDKANILIAHNPRYFNKYSQWGADLTVSGHVHGGLMRLGTYGVVSPNLTLFPKYSGGKYIDTDSNSSMILSCGLGTHHLPIRIFNPAEISHIVIKKITT